MSLQTPYYYTGLGKTNSYVENFWAVTGIDGLRAEKMYTPIIPNSQLVAFAEENDGKKWGLDLLVSPTQAMWMVMLSVVIILVVIGAIIIVLHCQEKAEDRKKREQHFDFF